MVNIVATCGYWDTWTKHTTCGTTRLGSFIDLSNPLGTAGGRACTIAGGNAKGSAKELEKTVLHHLCYGVRLHWRSELSLRLRM